MRRSSQHPEEGSSLIIALAMVLIVAVGIVALLGFADASFRAVNAVRTQRASSYAADSALQAAIQTLRPNATLGTTTGACPAPFPLNYSAPGQPAVVVQCNTIQARGAGVPGDSWPRYAIQSVGTSPSETGIKSATGASGNKVIAVGGPVASSSPAVAPTNSIDVTNLVVQGFTVQANGSCSGGIQVESPADLQCNTGQTYPDPTYPAQPFNMASLATPNPAPVCDAGQQTWRFVPGYYTDVNSFSPANAGGCNSSNYWFSPGVYYFDFGVSGGSKIWSVNGTVIGGEKKTANWTGSNGSGTPNTGVAASGSSRWCKTQLDGADSGVQWILGGESQIDVSSGIVELCADPTAVGTNQQVAVYGQKVDVGGSPGSGSTGSLTLYPTGITGTTLMFPNPVTNLLPIAPNPSAIDGQVKQSSTLSGSNDTARVTFSGFNQATVPAGSTISELRVRIAHFVSDANRISSLTVRVTANGVDLCGGPMNLTKFESLTTQEVVCAPDPVALPGPITVTYTATRQNQSPTVTVDGLELEVDYVATPPGPGLHAQSGCVAQVNGCPMLDVGKNNTTFVTWGTVYAPLAKVRVDFKNNSVFEFRRGVLARAVENVTVPPADTTTAFCLGFGTLCGGPARVVKLTAQVGGVTKVVALVRFVDAPSLGFAAQTLSWNVAQ
jgi:hypothetical protein